MTEPNKTIVKEFSATFYDWENYSRNKKVSWEKFQDWMGETLPLDAIDVEISIKETFEYDDQISNFVVTWKEKKTNPAYAKYEKWLAKQKKAE
jgi:hypothetical protein